MADTFTTNLNLTKPEIGESPDTWGDKLNDNFDDIDAVFRGDGQGTSVGLNVGTGKTFTMGGTANFGGVTNVSGALRFTGAAGGVSVAGNAWLPFINSSVGGGQARWRWGTGVGNTAYFGLQRNVAAGGDFSAVENSLYVDTTDSMTVKGNITAGGNLTAAGNVISNSDLRLKTEIRPILDALAKVTQMHGVTFERKAMRGARQTGLIAQDVQAVLPEAVVGEPGGYLSVAYGNLAGLFVEAFKELAARVAALEAAAAPAEEPTL